MTSRYMSYACALKVANWRISHIHAFFNQELLAFCTKTLACLFVPGRFQKKKPWVYLSTDLPLYIAEFRCRDACDKNQMEETKAESKDPENGAWCHVNDGILDEFSGWVGVVVACWRVEQIIKYCQLIYQYTDVFHVESVPSALQIYEHLTFTWFFVSGPDLDRGWHFLDASQKPLHDFSVGTFTPLHPLHLKTHSLAMFGPRQTSLIVPCRIFEIDPDHQVPSRADDGHLFCSELFAW